MTARAHRPRRPGHHLTRRIGHVATSLALVGCVAALTAGLVHVLAPAQPTQSLPGASGGSAIGTYSHHPVVLSLPAHPASYLGAYVRGVPRSYAPVESFAAATGVHPDIALYYSSWYEKFQSAFAIQAGDHGATPLIQIDPSDVNFAAIVAGLYDTYLKTLATAVAGYGAHTGHGVIIGFGHEMNGRWFSWGYRHVSPSLFVDAWRHIVSVFRQQGADDVTWLWTINIISKSTGIPNPAPWWPGSAYVNWVGIDGYYLKPSWTFASLFGPTIKAVRELTVDPILIAETAAQQSAGQPGKIADLFGGVRAYGLLGFVWFNANHTVDWRVSSPAGMAAFRQGAQTFTEPPA
jgi:mannan endo-1,4-beta-mannosidase